MPVDDLRNIDHDGGVAQALQHLELDRDQGLGGDPGVRLGNEAPLLLDRREQREKVSLGNELTLRSFCLCRKVAGRSG